MDAWRVAKLECGMVELLVERLAASLGETLGKRWVGKRVEQLVHQMVAMLVMVWAVSMADLTVLKKDYYLVGWMVL